MQIAMVDLLPQLRIEFREAEEQNENPITWAVDGLLPLPPSSTCDFITVVVVLELSSLLSFLNPPSASPCINMCRDGRKGSLL
jgi:hypothetical protein